MVRKIPFEWYVYEYCDDSDVVPLLETWIMHYNYNTEKGASR